MPEHLYEAYGLTIASPFSLPELLSAQLKSGQQPDVVIREAMVAPPGEFDGNDEYFVGIGQNQTLLFARRSGLFQINGGREIVFQPAKGVTSKALRLFLMGPALSMILHQRGNMVLHASGIAFRRASGVPYAIGFVGNSGQGKSTLATAMYERGHKAFADDVIAVPSVSSAVPLISPGFPMFKLWPPSVEALYGDLSNLNLLHPEHPDFLRRELSSRERFQTEPLPLRCLYTLEEGDTINSARLSPRDAHLALLHHSYWVADLPPAQRATHFHQCVELQKRLVVHRLQRPRDLSRLNDIMDVIEQDQREMGV